MIYWLTERMIIINCPWQYVIKLMLIYPWVIKSLPKQFRLWPIITTRGDSRNIEWFSEQLQLSGQIQGFVKGGAYFSSRPLKQGSGGCNPPGSYRVTLF